MPTEAEKGKPLAKTKEQIEAEFKKLHISGFDKIIEIGETINEDDKVARFIRLKGGAVKVILKDGAVKKVSTDTESGK